jgi:hypothetical protein
MARLIPSLASNISRPMAHSSHLHPCTQPPSSRDRVCLVASARSRHNSKAVAARSASTASSSPPYTSYGAISRHAVSPTNCRCRKRTGAKPDSEVGDAAPMLSVHFPLSAPRKNQLLNAPHVGAIKRMKSSMAERAVQQRQIEDVMMHTACFAIAQASSAKLLG